MQRQQRGGLHLRLRGWQAVRGGSAQVRQLVLLLHCPVAASGLGQAQTVLYHLLSLQGQRWVPGRQAGRALPQVPFGACREKQRSLSFPESTHCCSRPWPLGKVKVHI